MVLSSHGTRMSSGMLRVTDLQRKGGIQSIGIVFITILVFSAIATKRIKISINAGSVPKEIQDTQTYIKFITKPECFLNCLESLPMAQNANHSGVEEECPEYFQWIHEDLKPWRATGISREMVERGRVLAHIRVVIVGGRVFVENYKRAFQTRDVVTVWGILQLLRLYPGKLPDLDLMFECGDKPVIEKQDYEGSEATIPPPMFHYCGDNQTYDIVFPDWSFWGWSEVNIKPWELLKKDLKESSDKIKWMDREPNAYWKGNTLLGPQRRGLVKCNVSKNKEWNTQIYDLDWRRERKEGFKTTDLASQCRHRYKIYVEGHAWSVSQKYILACDSMSLVIDPHYYDFYSRGLLPTVHYWPISENDMCRSINNAVKWGNKHAKKAQEIGKAGSSFVQEKLMMRHVYDYMFHVLYQYAKLLKYQPTVPKGAVEVCSETLICNSKGLRKKFRSYSMVSNPAESSPCTLQPQFDQQKIQDLLKRKEHLKKQIEPFEAAENIRRMYS